MYRGLFKRNQRLPSERARARRVVQEELFTRLLLSRPVPRELLIDALRADANYDRTSPVGDAHAAHIRALRQRRRPIDAEQFTQSHPWSRRVPTVVVDADEFESLLEQVRELHQLSDQVTSLKERLDEKGFIRSDSSPELTDRAHHQ